MTHTHPKVISGLDRGQTGGQCTHTHKHKHKQIWKWCMRKGKLIKQQIMNTNKIRHVYLSAWKHVSRIWMNLLGKSTKQWERERTFRKKSLILCETFFEHWQLIDRLTRARVEDYESMGLSLAIDKIHTHTYIYRYKQCFKAQLGFICLSNDKRHLLVYFGGSNQTYTQTQSSINQCCLHFILFVFVF